MSVAEYLARERESEIKHEYVYDEIFETPGAKRAHNRIVSNSFAVLQRQLDSDECVVYTSDMQIGISGSAYYYPDLSIVCGEERFEDDDELTLRNPILVLEVTSQSSETRDRTEKLYNYQDISSLEAILIIDQQRLRADLHRRELDGWRAQVFTELSDVIALSMLNCELPLDALYRGVELEAAPD